MPVARTSAMAWSMNGKGYIFGGRDAQRKLCNDVWAYSPQEDMWEKVCDAPIHARVNGVAIAVGETVYIGLGFNGGAYQTTAYLQDWWAFSVADTSWTQLASYPNANTVGAIAYAEGNKIYCIHGFGTGFTADVLCYDIATDTWTSIDRPNRRDEMAMAGAGASLNGRHFYGTGYNTRSLDYWYEITDFAHWQKRTHVPHSRENAVCAASGKYIYLAGGRHFGGMLTDGKVFDDILRYDILSDQWTLAGHTEEKAENRIAFTIGNAAYIGLGENEKEVVVSSLYRIED